MEACRSLDVNRLHRDGCLRPGWSGSLSWECDGEKVAWIRMRSEENRLVLNYRFRRNDEDWQEVDEPISIIRVPCRYGGRRPYFVCPGVVNGRCCCRRVVKLYGPGRYFLCRHCYRLAYASQSEDAMDRARRRAGKIRIKLGGRSDMPEFNPPKPKGMWHSTYNRLCNKAMAADEEAEEAFEFMAVRLMARLSRRTDERRTHAGDAA